MRKLDWAIRLNKYLVTCKDKEFRIGRYDCTIFTAGAVKAITGEDPMKEFRGEYASLISAKKALKLIGGGSLYSVLVSKFGKPVNGMSGQKGDVAYHEKSCGIVLGNAAIFIGEKGHVMIPINRLEKAFRVK